MTDQARSLRARNTALSAYLAVAELRAFQDSLSISPDRNQRLIHPAGARHRRWNIIVFCSRIERNGFLRADLW